MVAHLSGSMPCQVVKRAVVWIWEISKSALAKVGLVLQIHTTTRIKRSKAITPIELNICHSTLEYFRYEYEVIVTIFRCGYEAHTNSNKKVTGCDD